MSGLGDDTAVAFAPPPTQPGFRGGQGKPDQNADANQPDEPPHKQIIAHHDIVLRRIAASVKREGVRGKRERKLIEVQIFYVYAENICTGPAGVPPGAGVLRPGESLETTGGEPADLPIFLNLEQGGGVRE